MGVCQQKLILGLCLQLERLVCLGGSGRSLIRDLNRIILRFFFGNIKDYDLELDGILQPQRITRTDRLVLNLRFREVLLFVFSIKLRQDRINIRNLLPLKQLLLDKEYGIRCAVYLVARRRFRTHLKRLEFQIDLSRTCCVIVDQKVHSDKISYGIYGCGETIRVCGIAENRSDPILSVSVGNRIGVDYLSVHIIGKLHKTVRSDFTGLIQINIVSACFQLRRQLGTVIFQYPFAVNNSVFRCVDMVSHLYHFGAGLYLNG